LRFNCCALGGYAAPVCPPYHDKCCLALCCSPSDRGLHRHRQFIRKGSSDPCTLRRPCCSVGGLLGVTAGAGTGQDRQLWGSTAHPPNPCSLLGSYRAATKSNAVKQTAADCVLTAPTVTQTGGQHLDPAALCAGAAHKHCVLGDSATPEQQQTVC
jgi:hypothetical protein